MNPRERVLTVFEHEIPDRLPCWCGASAEFWDKAKKQLNLNDEQLSLRFRDDFRRVYSVYTGPKHTLAEGVTCRSVFGIDRTGLGYGQPLSHPLAEASLKEIHDYPWPDPEWMDVSTVRDQALVYKNQYAILGGEWCPFWHDAIDLLGMENLYIKMYTEPEIVQAIIGHIVDFYFETSKRIFDAAGDVIDIFFIGNDFGGQNGPLMGPEQFKTFLFPYLQKLSDLGHRYDLKVQMHCCGGIYELVPLMIEAGIDALHALQPDCIGMDLQKIKDAFGSKIVLNGGIDSKHILIDGTVDFTRKMTRQVMDIMMPGGGYIAGASHDAILEETPVENVVAMFDTIHECGNYHQ